MPAGVADGLREALDGIPSVVLPSSGQEAGSASPARGQDAVGVMLVTLKRDAARVEPILERLGWEDARLPESAGQGNAEALRTVDDKIDGLRARQSACGDELSAYFGSIGAGLGSMWAALP